MLYRKRSKFMKIFVHLKNSNADWASEKEPPVLNTIPK